MKKIKGKILYWIFQRYFKHHIVVLTDQKVISDMEMTRISSFQRHDMLSHYFKEIVHDIVKEAMLQGLVVMEREKDAELGGEILRAKVRFWK